MSIKHQKESGNAFIYILIAIALFAALSMTLTRQTDTSEASTLSDEKAELLATQLINYAGQVRQAYEQLSFIVTPPPDETVASLLDFTLPTHANFNTGTHTYKVYHPEGMGINLASLPVQAIGKISTDPPGGWFMGRFNNVEWTELDVGNGLHSDGASDLPYEEVILIAYQINQQVCEKINQKITGNSSIPSLTAGTQLREVLIDDSLQPITNSDFDRADCLACDDKFSLCISNAPQDSFSFYTIIAEQ